MTEPSDWELIVGYLAPVLGVFLALIIVDLAERPRKRKLRR